MKRSRYTTSSLLRFPPDVVAPDDQPGRRAPRPALERCAKVGCERPDGTLNVHRESEFCEVCATVESAALGPAHGEQPSTTGAGPRSLPLPQRTYTPPLRTPADHEDDELAHGRVGASRGEQGAMSTGAFAVLMLGCAAVLIATHYAGWRGALLVGAFAAFVGVLAMVSVKR